MTMRKKAVVLKSTESKNHETLKLQKILADRGLGSRREMERWIAAGRVAVNSVVAGLGLRVKNSDVIEVDGKVLSPPEAQATRVLIYHKPVGEVCTRHDPEGRPTIFQRLPRLHRQRWISVGRLDINTEGLIVLTNNGELAHRLLHPSFGVEREYAVRVLGKVTPEIVQRLLKGVSLEDGQARFQTITDAGGKGANHWYHVTLSEGRKREVRRLWESQNLTVSRLIRIRFGHFVLPPDLSRGQLRELEADAWQTIVRLV